MCSSNDVQAVDAANVRLATMADDASKIAFEQDSLKLATDISNIGRMLDRFLQTERARHLSKVAHLKAQHLACFGPLFLIPAVPPLIIPWPRNTLGASFVSSYMKKWLNVRGGTTEEMESALLQAIPRYMVATTLLAKTLRYSPKAVLKMKNKF